MGRTAWARNLQTPLRDAQLAAEAAEAAAEQGAFEAQLLGIADQIFRAKGGLLGEQKVVHLPDDVERFTDDLRDHVGATRVAEDVDSADLSGVSGTPTLHQRPAPLRRLRHRHPLGGRARGRRAGLAGAGMTAARSWNSP